MNTKKNKKSGFTLVELMVVAIIVAILAAVAIPLMTGNKNKAMATEGQAGCSTIATQLRIYKAENGTYATANSDPYQLQGLVAGDLTGKYFTTYVISAQGLNTYTITGTGVGKAAGMQVTLTQAGVWGEGTTTAALKWL